MKVFKLTSIAILIGLTAPVLAAQANDAKTSEELRADLERIQRRLDALETAQTATAATTPSDTQFTLYGSFRPILGYTHTSSNDDWGVEDANSRIGFTSTHQISEGLTAFAQGEFKVKIDEGGNFGDVRKAFAGIEGVFGRVAIGQQAVTQEIIYDPVDIFNRADTPLAYDAASPFRLGNLVTYRKQFGDFLFSADAQFDEDQGEDETDFVNGGIRYKTDFIYIASAYYNRQFIDGTEENTVGVTIAKNFDKLYLATAYQNIDRDDRDTGYTVDAVASYPIFQNHKLKLGYGKYDNGGVYGNNVKSGYDAYNTTLEWQATQLFKAFVEYERKNYDDESNREDEDQVRIGMRYDFKHKF